jgi:hypothetical protein
MPGATMDMRVGSPLKQLKQGTFLRLPDVKGRGVAVFDGLVWVTQDGDPRDVFLRGGDSFQFDHDGLALIEALTPATLLVLQAKKA